MRLFFLFFSFLSFFLSCDALLILISRNKSAITKLRIKGLTKIKLFTLVYLKAAAICIVSYFITERLCQTEDLFLHQKSMYMETSTKNAGLLAMKTHLDEVLKEKNKKIEE